MTEPVDVRTLNEAAAALGIDYIDLLKIDVEGHQLDVLEGAANLLERRVIGAIQFEFGGTDLDTRTTLQDFYYYLGQYRYALHIIRPNATTWPLGLYREIYEHYRFTNY